VIFKPHRPQKRELIGSEVLQRGQGYVVGTSPGLTERPSSAVHNHTPMRHGERSIRAETAAFCHSASFALLATTLNAAMCRHFSSSRVLYVRANR